MRALFSSRRVFVFIMLAGLFVWSARGITDPDFWWHLRTGQYIVQTHTVPHSDFYSFTKYGEPWIAHEWLSEVLIYLMYRLASWLGVILGFGAVITLAFWLAYQRCPARTQPYMAGIVTLAGAAATIPFWGARPQVFSMLLTGAFLFLLACFSATRRPSYLWLLVPLTLLWVNLHGGFAIGLALIALAATGDLLDTACLGHGRFDAKGISAFRHANPGPDPLRAQLLDSHDPPWMQVLYRQCAPYAVVFCACLLVVPMNPNGWRMYAYPFQTLASHSIQGYILEWASPDFHLARFQWLAIILLATFAAMVISPRRARPSDLLLVTVTAYAALRSSRHIPIFILAAIPVLATHAHAWISTAFRGATRAACAAHQRNEIAPRTKLALNVTLTALVLGASILRLAQMNARQPLIEAETQPKAATDFIQQQRLPGPIFNSYEWGGYMIWKLYPAYRVYVDGRSDLYGDAFLDEYVLAYRGESDWRQLFRRFAVQTAIVTPHSPVAVSLEQDSEWTKRFADKQALVFTRSDPAWHTTASLRSGDNR